jgi:hypothetical protein
VFGRRDLGDVDRRENRRRADRESADEAEHVERFEVPAERGAERGDEVEVADGLQRIARSVDVAGLARGERADERADEPARDREARPETSGFEMEDIAHGIRDARNHDGVETEEQTRETRGDDHAKIPARSCHALPLIRSRVYKMCVRE